MKPDPVYCYPPDFTVLRNRLDIRDAGELRRQERLFTRVRGEQGLPEGDFDLDHLKAIHGHLFQDVYGWAGEIRTVEIEKGGTEFGYQQMIAPEMAAVHRRLKSANHLRGLAPGEFTAEAARVLGDVNYIHPFRDGNGRAQLAWLAQLGAQAGHQVDLARLERDPWIEASKAASAARPDFQPMARCIEATITRERSRDESQRHQRMLDQARERAAPKSKDQDRER
ncbi:MAG: Fic family protein [Pseudomonadota bacterium]